MLQENKTLHENDVVKLIHLVSKTWYRSEDSLKYFLTESVNLGDELKDILNLYPNVLCEPLDNHYTLLRALGSTNEDLIFDLCNFYQQRGITLASFLVCLHPSESYKNILLNVRNSLPNKNDNWIIELALSEINGVSWQLFPEISTLLHNLRNSFKELKVPRIEMKKMWTYEEIEAFAEKQMLVKKLYREQGTDAALTLIRELKLNR